MSSGVLARKYAQAFCTVFLKACSVDMIEKLARMSAFFVLHKKALFFLGLPQLSLQVKKDALLAIITTIGLPPEMNTLFVLLIAQRRATLIPQVCMQLRLLILQKNSMLECTVSSAQELTQDERDTLSDFFAQQTKHDIKAQYVIDEKLIAGIAMHSTTYAWEYSIRKQLHTINQTLIR